MSGNEHEEVEHRTAQAIAAADSGSNHQTGTDGDDASHADEHQTHDGQAEPAGEGS